MNGTAGWLVNGGPWIYALLVFGCVVTVVGIMGFIGGLMLRSRRKARWLSLAALVLGVGVLAIGWRGGAVQTARGAAAAAKARPGDRPAILADAASNAQTPKDLAMFFAVMPLGAAILLGVRGFVGWGGGGKPPVEEAS